jgi:arylsulfatase A-like enzyme
MAKPWNVVWISTHDINPDLGCYRGVWPGAEYAVTPRLDRLAAEGAVWTHAFAAAPVCAPARSAIITGCYPTAIGTMHMRSKAVPPPQVRLLPEYFRQAGYYCTNNSFTDFQVATPRTAFDDCSDTAHWRNRPDPDTPFFATFQGMITHESQIYLDDQTFAERTRHVRDADRHDPADAPLPPYYPDTEAFRISWARYSDLVTEMDHWVGEILDQLEEDGLADSTIVVFWSDHGRGMPRAKRWVTEPGLREPLIIRWPGVIEPGTVQTDIVQTMDLAPTMLSVCGLQVPEHMHGVAFLDADGGAADEPNEYAYAGRDRMDENEDTSRSVRDQRYRYIRHFHPDRAALQHTAYPDQLATWADLRRIASEEARQVAAGEVKSLFTPLQRSLVAPCKPVEELYDLDTDPHETTNLAEDPDHATPLIRLREALQGWQDRFGDLGLVPEADLIQRWRPGGRPRVTDRPRLSRSGDTVSAECDTPGALIAWTDDPPTGSVPQPLMQRVSGDPVADGRWWRLYTTAVALPGDGRLWFQAWRLGYEPSPEVGTTSG